MIFSPERAKEKISWPRRMDADTQPSSSFRWCWKPCALGIGEALTGLPLPHHQAYGSVPRRFARVECTVSH